MSFREKEETYPAGYTQTLKLVSTIYDILEVSCLSFAYKTQYVDLQVKNYTANGIENMMIQYIHYNNEVETWKDILVDVYPAQIGIILEIMFTNKALRLSMDASAGVSNISLTSGSCRETCECCYMIIITIGNIIC